VYTPRDVVHTYKSIGNDVGKLLVIGIPAGFEKFFEELEVPVTDENNLTPPSDQYDIDRIDEISKKHSVMYMPALKKIKIVYLSTFVGRRFLESCMSYLGQPAVESCALIIKLIKV
jgi:hypothetical protein